MVVKYRESTIDALESIEDDPDELTLITRSEFTTRLIKVGTQSSG